MPVVDRPVVPAPRRDRRRTASVVAAGLALVGAATACTDADGVEDDRLVLEVGDEPPATQEEEVALWEQRIAEFEERHPDIRVDSTPVPYSPDTFRAQLEADALPDVLLVPFTEPQGLIARGELSDLSTALADTGLEDLVNPGLQGVVSDGEGVYGVPVSAYSMGLVYNRAVFTAAGLDPDAPPTTWDEVRAAAAQITDRTDAVGLAHMGAENYGGFTLTAETYSFGGRVQDDDGQLLLTDGPMAEALELLRAMRWEDGSVDPEAGHTSETAAARLASGRVGMYVAAPDVYGALVGRLGMSPDDVGVGALPRGTEGDDYATLAGGTAAIVPAGASEEVRRAAVEWVEFSSLERYVDEEAALAEAEALRGTPVFLGVPGLSPVDEGAYAQWQEWVADDIDVPLDNFRGYTAALPEQEVQEEPGDQAQVVYRFLDDVVQAVLVDESTDIDTLLAETQEELAAELERG